MIYNRQKQTIKYIEKIILKKNKLFSKKLLTKEKECGNISSVVTNKWFCEVKKLSKKFKKMLDNNHKLWYTNLAVAKTAIVH